jgi:hypothetical protein
MQDSISRRPERPYWTLAWRKRTANRFQRATDWQGTWAQAFLLAGRFAETHPDLQVYYTSTAAAEVDGYVAAEDCRNILTDSGKRVRVADTGTLSDLLSDLSVPEPEAARELWHSGADVVAGVPSGASDARRASEGVRDNAGNDADGLAVSSAAAEPCTSMHPGMPGLTCHLAWPHTVAHYSMGYTWPNLRPGAADGRCSICHRDAHRPGTGWQGHAYAAPATS